MKDLYRFVIESTVKGKIDKETAARTLKMIKDESLKGNKDIDNIAIIGIGAEFPCSSDIDDYWNLIINKADFISDFPNVRKNDIEDYLKYINPYDENKYLQAAYIKEIDKFDYKMFKLSPKEASLMDPYQRMFLQTAWHSIEDAGYGGKKIIGSNTGVYVGYASNAKDSYQKMIYDIDKSLISSATVGNTTSMLPSRISYLLDLKGPSMVIDTACSSALVAVHLACNSLQNGDCDMAIAGGIRINLIPLADEYMKCGIEAGDGRTRTFDDSADGSGIGEGVFSLILKPLSKALKDKDNIYAVIKGSAINQDGNSIGITAPNPSSQTEVINKAWNVADIDPSKLDYIEVHGTATKLGDPIEIQGLQNAFIKYTNKKQFCAVSSFKTNIGHLYESSGIAAIIKAILALKYKKIPPSRNFIRPNSKIKFQDTAIYVNTTVREWKKDNEPRICGVSAFGLSGTNCHLVLEEAPQIKDIECKEQNNIITFSAKSKKALINILKEYNNYFSKNENQNININNIAYTANTGRGHYNYRMAIITDNYEDFKGKVRKIKDSDLNLVDEKWFYYSKDNLVGSNKKNVLNNEAKVQKDISFKIKEKIKNIEDKNNLGINLLKEICEVYVKGGDIDWEYIYKGSNRRKVSLPVYPFDKERCWINIPKNRSILLDDDKNQYYITGWEKENLIELNEESSLESVLIFNDSKGIGKNLAIKLKEKNADVIEVEFGQEFKRIDNKFIITGAYEDYEKLLSSIEYKKVSRIIHLSSIRFNDTINNLSELHQSKITGVFSLFYLVKSIVNLGMNQELRINIISDYINEITKEESVLKPENAMVIGFAKVIGQEYPNIICEAIDIDDNINEDLIVKEIRSNKNNYLSAYRNGQRYIETFRELDIKEDSENKLLIKDEGVYIVTGGAGGIGTEIIKRIAKENKINVAIIGRTEVPDKVKWQEVLTKGVDTKLIRIIKRIKELELVCNDVSYYSSDVSDLKRMESIITEIRTKYKKINGVIHSAGVAGAGYIVNKEEKKFNEVISPKVDGTWILDKLTEKDNLDFFILFSSVITLLGEAGQGDYVAANSYIDSYAAYRNKKGKKTITINWVSWKDTGMSVDFGINVDTLFKAIPTNKAVNEFMEVINKNISKVLIGDLNYSTEFMHLINALPYRLSTELTEKLSLLANNFQSNLENKNRTAFIENGKLRILPMSKSSKNIICKGKVRLVGKEDNKYNEVQEKLGKIYNEILGFEEISIYDGFFDLGGDSITLNKMHELIEQEFPGKVKLVDLFTYTTIEKLSEYITEKDKNKKIEKPKKTRLQNNDIAIIGVSARLPKCYDIETYWSNIESNVDCISDFPVNRKVDVDNYLKNYVGIEKKVSYLKGAYLDRIDSFDYKFFNISPKEAKLMDPCQRIFLEVAWNLIEDSGYGGNKITGSNTGVYIGFSNNSSYQKMIIDSDPDSLPLSVVGNTASVISSRISYLLDLKGPSLVVDSACSSSLVAIHLACEALRNGDCNMAIAGGVKINCFPMDMENFKIGIESSDGKTKAFDESADGAGIGEGVSAVMLKPMELALKDNDNIYAVIKGSAINQDGRSIGITAPNPESQKEVIIKAWESSGINPEDISYIEAHGTGTNLGDPIEIEALDKAFKSFTDRKQFCGIGSVKNNIGHLHECAGMASLIKVILALKHKVIPPTINFNMPNKRINFNDSAIYVNSKARSWLSLEKPRTSAISAFGLSGTNCHMVLQEAPIITEDVDKLDEYIDIITFSAKSKEALVNIIDRYSYVLENDLNNSNIKDICYTANTGRGHFNYRVAIIIKSKDDFKNKVLQINNQNLEELDNEWFFYGRCIKKLPKKDIVELSNKANALISEKYLSEFNKEMLLEKLCDLYIKGAEVTWDKFYENEYRRKVSIPVYPFEKERCWLDLNSNKDLMHLSNDIEQYFTVGWKEENIDFINKNELNQKNVLLFNDEKDIGESLANKLRKNYKEVIEVNFGEAYCKLGNEKFVISGLQEDYKKLLADIDGDKIIKIIHLSSIKKKDEIETIEELNLSKLKGVYSLFYLTKEMINAGIRQELDLYVISDYVSNVINDEKVIKPENATIIGLSKVISQEYPNINCISLDIDEDTSIDVIYKEIQHYEKINNIAYRYGKRYVEEFKEVDMIEVPDKKIEIKSKGVYVITGGTGGIGIEIAKRLVEENNINIALINRSKIPDRDSWKDILNKGKEEKLIRNINAIKQIEKTGSTVSYYSADVSDYDVMKRVLNDIRSKYGNINGIIHSAGVAGAGYIIRKDEEVFSNVIKPKVDGTWILDRLTEKDKLDFFVLFSSAVSLSGEASQGDYVAANSYLDSFTSYRNKKGKRTLTINWVAWKKVGMSVEFGINIDAIYKALDTIQATDAFMEVLNKNIERILIGELNYNSEFISIFAATKYKLSPKLKNRLDIAKNLINQETNCNYQDKKVIKNGDYEMAVIEGDKVIFLPRGNRSLNKNAYKKNKRIKVLGIENSENRIIEERIAEIYSEILGIDEVNLEDSFFELGGDSVMLTRMLRLIEKEYPGKVKLVDLFSYTNISKLAKHINNQLKGSKQHTLKISKNIEDDIAIIGIGLKLPKANSIEEYWSNIVNDLDCTEKLPIDRKNKLINYLRYSKKIDTNNIDFFNGGYLDDIDKFDYKFFKFTPKEAKLMDPCQRIFLETAWKTIEDAGYLEKGIIGSNTGVYVGFAGSSDYERMIYDLEPKSLPIAMTGNRAAILPTRISYLLDLKGPTMVIDTACSSSLVSVHLACEALKKGKCEMALAGGVRINLLPVNNEYLKMGIEAIDFKTKSFDDNSDGTSIGEGVAAVMLKPLKKAIEDNDKIYSVIKGTSINQDGSSLSITAPNPNAQANVIINAWEESGIDPETISYIETHGTGTRLGDPIEIAGIEEAFKRYTDKKQFVAISAIKTNIGHLHECSGMAGLIKATLALKYKKIPSLINFKRPNKNIDFHDSPVYVNTKIRDWCESSSPRRCGVNAFGLSGTNCHIVLEESPKLNKMKEYLKIGVNNILLISANSKYSLNHLIGEYKEFLSHKSDDDLVEICFNANTRKLHYKYRIALIIKDITDLRLKIEKLRNEDYENIVDENIFYSDNNTLNDEETNTLNDESREVIEEILSCNGLNLYLGRKLCVNYVKGADIDWTRLFDGYNVKKISMPVYPFERTSCWLEAPKEYSDENLYCIRWKEKEIKNTINDLSANNTFIIFKDKFGIGELLATKLRGRAFKVIEVEIGNSFEKLDKYNYRISYNNEEFDKLLNEILIESIGLIKIIYLSNLCRTDLINLDELENSKETGVYSLFHLVKSIGKKIENKVDIILISENVNEVTGNETRLNPNNAILFGYGKVIKKEFKNISCRALDIDEKTTTNQIISEIESYQTDDYYVAYRNGIRYVEEFGRAEIEKDNIEIKDNGVYVITGGAGGIGFEIAKYFANKNKVKIVLINRSKIPERTEWINILNQGINKKQINIINKIKCIEKTGSEVLYYSADISNEEEVSKVISDLTSKYSRINGIVHAAGVAKDSYIEDRDIGELKEILLPKVNGTWILDKVTDNLDLDFVILFSSVATIFTGIAQADYIAANSYLDSFTAYRNRKGKKTLTVNWTTWKEVGMAYNNKFTPDTIFKALSTKKAINEFDKILGSNLQRVLIGTLNLNNIGLSLINNSSVNISKDISDLLTKFKNDIEAKKVSEGIQTEVKVNLYDNCLNVEKKLIEICKDILEVEEINIYDNFFDLGCDSILLMNIFKEINKAFPEKVLMMDMFEYSSIYKLSKKISQNEIQDKNMIVEEIKDNNNRDVAIIGMALNFPKAQSIDEYWLNIKNGVFCGGKFPIARKEDVKRLLKFKNIPINAVKYYKGAYLEEIDKFDYNFFHLPPKEMSITDPNQRLFLQTAVQAINDAGYGDSKIVGTNTGVYLGFSNQSTYRRIIGEIDRSIEDSSIIGNTASVATGRLSYLLDLKGPSIVVDTACSSSLVAVHLARKAIIQNECDMAIAGGVKLDILPLYKKGDKTGIGMESSDGLTRTFDDSSSGTGSGEGVGAILLKSLDAAIRDKDNIYAVIKGSATNQDGSSAGITAPNPVAQENVIVSAWEDANINPETIGYIETHGTGTKLGDPIEILGIKNAFRRYTSKSQLCAVGSVKTNIGHLSEAAGIASVIKSVLALKNKEIPRTINFNMPNRKIDFGDSPVYVNTRQRKWISKGVPRRCGVSGFGMSGTNCHIILEEYSEKNNKKEPLSKVNILNLSAKSITSLSKLIKNYKEFLEINSELDLRDICYTANTSKEHYRYRLSIISSDLSDLRSKINKLVECNLNNITYTWAYFGDIGDYRDGDINEINRKKDVNDSAEKVIKLFVTTKNYEYIDDIVKLYIRGADIRWEELYSDYDDLRRLHLPAYPFEDTRCWIDIPSVWEEDDNDFTPKYYLPCWIESESFTGETHKPNEYTVIFKDTKGVSDRIAYELISKGINVIEVHLSNCYSKVDDAKYEVGNNVEDYLKLFEAIKEKNVTQIIHMCTLGINEVKNIEILHKSQARGVYSLFYIVKAIVNSGMSRKVDLLLISEYANEVTKKEIRINPQNASIIGLGKVIRQENPNLLCRAIDLDEETRCDDIISEVMCVTDVYQTAYRSGKRYIEEVRDIEVAYAADKKVEIKNKGVYIITGGTGGIGLEFASYFANKGDVNIALFNRNSIPKREKWNEILEENKDKKLVNKILKIKEIEELGATVICKSVDVSDIDQVTDSINKLRESFGKINGVIHSAGIPGDGFILNKKEDVFTNVLKPKILGTWILDKATEEDDLDFFIMFSSAATMFSEVGQGDYVAANSYLDSYAAFRNRQGKKTLTINWVAWREAGMAVDYGVNSDGVFRSITTNNALKYFEEVLNKDINRVVIGKINAGSESLCNLSGISLKVSYKIEQLINESISKYNSKPQKSYISNKVMLEGKKDESFSALETKIAQMYSEVLGFEKINIYDNFFDLGGDSVMLMDLYKILESEFGEKVKLVDLFEYTSVESLSNYISKTSEEIEHEVSEEELLESKLRKMIAEIDNGEISIEDAINNINEL